MAPAKIPITLTTRPIRIRTAIRDPNTRAYGSPMAVGGTFLDIWTPSTFARAGMCVSDTDTPGRVYQLSSEHHVRHEVQIRNSANWAFYALQTEEERGESGRALPLDIEDSHDLTFANFHIYRVISSFQPFPWAVQVSNSRGLHFRNLHCYSNSKVSFDASIYDRTHDLELRQREFAWLDISGKPRQSKLATRSRVLARDAKVEKLAGGFFNISGGAVAPKGDFYLCGRSSKPRLPVEPVLAHALNPHQ